MVKYKVKDKSLIFNKNVTSIDVTDLHCYTSNGPTKIKPELSDIENIILPEGLV